MHKMILFTSHRVSHTKPKDKSEKMVRMEREGLKSRPPRSSGRLGRREDGLGFQITQKEQVQPELSF